MATRSFGCPIITAALIVALSITSGCASNFIEYSGDESPKVLREKLYQIEDFQLSGKLGFRNTDEAFSVAINTWKQTADQYDIQLSSTFLGLGSVNILGTPTWIEINESGEEPIQSPYPNEALEQLLGMPLPVQRIRYWIKGVPAPQSSAIEVKDERGLVSSITQDQWMIELDRYHDVNGLPLPSRIKINRDGTRITLAVSQWSIL
ncbi:hypothetical protein A3742_06375 [Oleiphilus sp. HI0071]|uniref:lipoprotein insertase outer membrane protein LolB n=3 Tax=Oleiphilus TaxID=141450 RepID=UPI0007C2C6A9|nr:MULTISPECIES: lipoprotein insertase outer membrane protein LolB [unclassified Oleiphilus]KZY72458.1 hypothetical protein A3737_10075 [Oleiphilus sp. HI0065]KZY78167.1 hypothetical protein A3742_23455 [Oleiphilus sp. HI0071]KZZ04729.1 hypothetical protein A3744_08550 [Oleiphilus sp. HI0073]KZZ52698.1 hypothetical protein A3760_10350 [Oleiphilus sp. HI0122]KZZ81116.1 hypothetical protein A3767_08730 [Oleiphilus sp. HI0133]